MTRAAWHTIPIHDNGESLVNLADHSFSLDPVYFTQGFSADPRFFLREQVAEKLLRVQEQLGDNRLKIWDAWRSRAVQIKLYEGFRSALAADHPEWDAATLDREVTQFIASPVPERTPPHSTGGAVDLTIVDRQGRELDMGTVFDHFGPEAEPFYFDDRDSHIRDNRRLLREAMVAQGFTFDQYEWWHFDFGNQLWAQKKDTTAIYGERTAPD